MRWLSRICQDFVVFFCKKCTCSNVTFLFFYFLSMRNFPLILRARKGGINAWSQPCITCFTKSANNSMISDHVVSCHLVIIVGVVWDLKFVMFAINKSLLLAHLNLKFKLAFLLTCCRSVCNSVQNFYLANNLWTVSDRALIFHMSIPSDKTFQGYKHFWPCELRVWPIF